MRFLIAVVFGFIGGVTPAIVRYRMFLRKIKRLERELDR